jgi:hypothetical protein
LPRALPWPGQSASPRAIPLIDKYLRNRQRRTGVDRSAFAPASCASFKLLCGRMTLAGNGVDHLGDVNLLCALGKGFFISSAVTNSSCLGIIQQRYGLARDMVRKDIDAWLKKHRCLVEKSAVNRNLCAMRAGDEQGPRSRFVLLELILKSFAEQHRRAQWPGRNRNKERSWLRS